VKTTRDAPCERLRQASEPVWTQLLAHPFLTELVDGTLPLDSFRFYLEQDRLFLDDYARALAAGAARSHDDAELRWFAAALRYTTDVERVANGRLLERVIAEGAQDHGGSLELGPAGRGYVSFLLEVSFRRSPLELVVALLPCPWSYAEIGRSLADASVEQPIYRDWVDYLRSDEALALSDTMVGDLDARLDAAGSARLEPLAATFHLAVRYELAFWDAAYCLTQWPDLAAAHLTERNA
jgi:thiaminase (transcriptional activator TenA)